MVSILAIIDNYWLNRYTLEAALKACRETEVELLVVNNTGDARVGEFLAHVINAETKPDEKLYPNVVKIGEIDEITFNKASAYNKLIAEAKGEYICVYNSHCNVGKSWLYDLLHYHALIQKAGICAIPEFESKKAWLPLSSVNLSISGEPELVNLWLPLGEGSVSGILLFKKELIAERGNFNMNEGVDYIKEFCQSVASKGYENFYIPEQITVNAEVKNKAA